MFKRDYSWIDDYINNYANNPPLSQTFKTLKKELECQSNTIEKLRYELSKYKPKVRKKK